MSITQPEERMVSLAEPTVIDVRDMYAVHLAFRRGLGEARGQLADAADAGPAVTGRLADYLGELLWLVHAHHAGEDALLYPLLVERVPQEHALFDRMEAQHEAVTGSLEAARAAALRYGETGSGSDGNALADACEALAATLTPHLDEEEQEILPIAARHITQLEWAQLPPHAFAMYSGARMWMPFGLVLEGMPPDIAQLILAIPSPIAQMWTGGRSDAFSAEMAAIRGGGS